MEKNMDLTQMTQMFCTKYVAYGFDAISKKKVQFAVTAESVDNVRAKMFKDQPRVVIQAIYPDVESKEILENFK